MDKDELLEYISVLNLESVAISTELEYTYDVIQIQTYRKQLEEVSRKHQEALKQYKSLQDQILQDITNINLEYVSVTEQFRLCEKESLAKDYFCGRLSELSDKYQEALHEYQQF